MFTGIVDAVGTLVERDDTRFAIRAGYDPAGIAIGASIACDGCCLTVTRCEADDGGAIFHVDVSNETLASTTLGSWTTGRRINLERALALGAELGGHIVAGHVDGVATVTDFASDGSSRRFTIAPPAGLARFIAAKGSVTLNGTSLTINEVTKTHFGVNIVPHTLAVTTWGGRRTGHQLNIEVDLLARYVARLSEFADAGQSLRGNG